MGYTANKRKKDLPLVLNKVDLQDNSKPMSADNLPIGMCEDQTSTLSSNFGTPRDAQEGKCIVGNNNVYISIGNTSLFNRISSTYNDFVIEFCIQGGIFDAISETILSTTWDSNIKNGFRIGLSTSAQKLFINFYDDNGVGYSFRCSMLQMDYAKIYHNKIKSVNNVIKWYVDEIEVEVEKITGDRASLGASANSRNFTIGFGYQVGLYGLQRKIFNIYINDGIDEAFYKCDCLSTTTLFDSSGNGNHGTIINYYSGFWGTQNIKSWQNDDGYSLFYNMLLYSQYYNNDNIWLRYGMNVTDNQLLAPDGTFTGCKIDTLGTPGDRLNQEVIVKSGALYTFSFFARKIDLSVHKYAVYDVTNYTYIVAPTDYTSQLNTSSYSRIEIGFTVPNNCNSIWVYPLRSNGVDLGSMALWGCQLEIGALKSYQMREDEPFNTLIPRDESVIQAPFKDVLGNDLQYIGKCHSKAKFVESNCWIGGGDAYITIPGLITTDTIEVYGNSDIPTCTEDGRLDLSANEKAYGLLIKRGGVIWSFLVCSEYIQDPSNHTYYDVSGNENHATLVNGSIANRGTQDEFHYSQLGVGSLAYFGVGSYLDSDFNYNYLATSRKIFSISMYAKQLTGSFGHEIIKTRDTGASGRFEFGVWGANAFRLRIDAAAGTLNKQFTYTTIDIDAILRVDIDTTQANYIDIIKLFIDNVEINGTLVTNNITANNFDCDFNGFQIMDYNQDITGFLSNLKIDDWFNMPNPANGLEKINNITFSKTGIIVDNQIPASTTDITKDALGNPLTIQQDGKSFLNTGNKLQTYKTPALVQAEQNNRFYTDVNDDIVDVEFTDFTGDQGDNQHFSNISEIGNVKNIRTHKQPLENKQLATELMLTNN